MIGIFKQKNPANIFLLLLFGVLIKLPVFRSPHSALTGHGDGKLYTVILKFLDPFNKSFPTLYACLAFGLLFSQALVLNRFMNTQRLMNRSAYFPGMSYLLITSLIPQWNFFSAPLLVNTIFIFVLYGLFKIYNQPNAKGAIFNIGLALGISTFIFFPSIAFIVWILLALLVMRPFRLNEWVLCILGIITPFYFYAIYIFITDSWSRVTFLPHLSIDLPFVRQSAWLAGSAFLLVVPFLAGAYFVQNNLRRMLIHARKGWSLLLLYILCAIFVPFVNNAGTFENWVMAAIPFAAFHACAYLYSSFRIFPVLLFWITVAFVLAYQYAGPGW